MFPITAPSVGPVITQWLPDINKPMEAVVRWNHIPADKIHGVLTGYLFTYGLSKVGKDAQEFPDMTSVQVRTFCKNSHVFTQTEKDVLDLVKFY